MSDSTSRAAQGRDDVYLNFIGGQWKQGSNPDWDENRNPARPGDIIGRATRSTVADVAKAIEAAKAAQKEWAAKPRPARAALLEKVSALMKARVDQFARTITLEEGKNLNEARGETLKSINVLDFTAAE